MSTKLEQSPLADCCHRTVARLRWLDNPDNSQDMNDEDWGIELALQAEVLDRAIALPSQSLNDLKAKAALALDDFNRFYPENEGRDPGERLIAVVLKEIVALCA